MAITPKEGMSPLDETHARRYLLGQLSEEEATALEDGYFGDGEALEQVWGVETDLVDAYVAGELGPGDRSAFESHYLSSPVHRDRVASARELRAATLGPAAPTAPRRAVAWTGWLALAAGLLLAAWWATRPGPPSPPVARNAPPSTVSAPPPTPTSAESPQPPATPALRRPVVAAFALSPMLLRGGQPTPVLRIPAGTDELAITLNGERPDGVPSSARLDFVIATVEGARVTGGQLDPGPKGLGVAHVPAGRLPAGDYILTVLPRDTPEAAPVLRYFFRVPAR
jgi:hypothetical protein